MAHTWTSDRIRELRQSLGWKQTDLALATGVTRHTVTTWETGTRSPTAHRVHALDTIRTLLDHGLMTGDRT